MIIMFYGASCPDSMAAMPWVEKLEKEGFEFKKIETWEHPANEKIVEKYSKILTKTCGRDTIVPSFIDGNRVLCEPHSYEELKKWIISK